MAPGRALRTSWPQKGCLGLGPSSLMELIQGFLVWGWF